MRNFLMSAMALTAVLVIPNVAAADDVADRNQAISICRAEAQATDAQAKLMAVIDNATKNAPAGSETAVAVVKSAVSAANNAIVPPA